MAFNALKQCRSSLHTPYSIRSLASSTTPKFAAASVTTSAMHQHSISKGGRLASLGAIYGPMWAVIGIMGGMVGVACCIGVHTAKQQLFHSPSVQVTKKRRECIPEVDSPDAVIRSADKFETKSFLRKVAHIQDNKHTANAPARGAYSRSREVETLKSVGVRS